jgi:hypothetical protein
LTEAFKLALPDHFCWSRVGTEAGQDIRHILERKEQERACNSGVFFWGIGNAIGPSLRELVRRNPEPEVLFSPIKSAAREEDRAPTAIAAWTSARDLSGKAFALPETSLVTSRFDPASTKATHYALVCFSDESLTPSMSGEKIIFSEVRNLLTGRPVGASQITAVVARASSETVGKTSYTVVLRARLVYPYLLELSQPMLLPSPDDEGGWSTVVGRLWEKRSAKADSLS